MSDIISLATKDAARVTPVEVERAVVPQVVVRPLARVLQERVQRRAELRGGCEVGEPERVHEDEAADPVAVIGGEPGGDRASGGRCSAP